MRSNKLQEFPETILQIKSLTDLDLSFNQLYSMPRALFTLPNLKVFKGKYNPIMSFTGFEFDSEEKVLAFLRLIKRGELPNSLTLSSVTSAFDWLEKEKYYWGLWTLCELAQWNEEIVRNTTNIQIVQKYISRLPEKIGILRNLKILNVSNNSLSSLPEGIGLLENLEVLHVDRNELKNVPEMMFHLQNLKQLNLSRNDIGVEEQARIQKDFPGCTIQI